MKVLIVDDNQAMRRMIRRVVAEVAEEISECGDGATASLSLLNDSASFDLGIDLCC